MILLVHCVETAASGKISKGNFFLNILKKKMLFSVWGSFSCYLLQFGAEISDLRVIFCILELKTRICMLFAGF